MILNEPATHRLMRTCGALLAAVLIGGSAPSDGQPAVSPTEHQVTLTPSRGGADAPVVVLLFSDFACGYCAQVDPVLAGVRERFGEDVQIVFKHNPLPIHPKAPLAHEAAVDAARQGRFFEMHDALFANQSQLEPADLERYAGQVGLDMPAFRAALADRRHRVVVERDMAEARALGVTGTPTLFVAGRRLVGVPSLGELTAFIESLLRGEDPASGPTDHVPPGTFDLTRAPGVGAADAPVTIVEFSDFQCPFCARSLEVTDRLRARYGDRVRWVFKHFPLDFHADAPLAHAAALAAGEQGKFWEMHRALFANQRALKRDDILRLASTLALDTERFSRDLDSEQSAAAIQRDIAEGARVGVEGTPTFFINGHRVVGAQPFDVFTSVIDRELAAAGRVSGDAAPGDHLTPEALDHAMSLGAPDAPVTIEWFADLGSALHQDAVALVRRVLDAHPLDVRLVYRHRPPEDLPETWLLYEATVAAAEQDRFWDVHDLLLRRPGQDRASLTAAAARLGLDRTWFEDVLTSGRARAVVHRHRTDGERLDVRGTPTFFINGTRLDGVVGIDVFEATIAAGLAQVRDGVGQ